MVDVGLVSQAADVEQNAPARDAAGQRADMVRPGSVWRDVQSVAPIVHSPIMEHVAKGVQMGEHRPVASDTHGIGRGDGSGVRYPMPAAEHAMMDSLAPGLAGRGQNRQSATDARARANRPKAPRYRGLSNAVQGAQFVVFPPTLPVAYALEDGLQFLIVHHAKPSRKFSWEIFSSRMAMRALMSRRLHAREMEAR
ncbi:hypothetical protein CHELA1G2_21128 [Hyphomicrobiales bacterium]|nr:hypothetical protein CHELA1G2_21128 [Hyphomicrobiales bacterium]